MKKINIFNESGEDTGYLGDNQQWWFDLNYKDSFELFDLDGFYSDHYFKHDHVGQHTAENYVHFVKEYFKRITGAELSSILEAGCAGGWFTKEFIKKGIDIIALEGAQCGVEASIRNGVPAERIIHHDLRQDIQLKRKFDMACCTEVAEHIETPFSSQLVKTLTDHANVVWFSFEEPGTNSAHYHHCNEQPAKFWINLFDFYGFTYIQIPDDVVTAVEWRGRYVFYNRLTYNNI